MDEISPSSSRVKENSIRLFVATLIRAIKMHQFTILLALKKSGFKFSLLWRKAFEFKFLNLKSVVRIDYSIFLRTISVELVTFSIYIIFLLIFIVLSSEGQPQQIRWKINLKYFHENKERGALKVLWLWIKQFT